MEHKGIDIVKSKKETSNGVYKIIIFHCVNQLLVEKMTGTKKGKILVLKLAQLSD